MSRSIVALAFLGLLACTGCDRSATKAFDDTPSSSSSGGHAGIQDAAAAFAKALATGDGTKIRAEMPPRDQLAKYFACGDMMAKRVDELADRATRSTAAPKGGTYLGLGDTQTQVVEDAIDDCKVTEQLLLVQVVTRWQVGEVEQVSALVLVRLGKRWYTFGLPAE